MEKISGTMAQIGTPGLETRFDIPMVIARMGKDLSSISRFCNRCTGTLGQVRKRPYEIGEWEIGTILYLF